MKKETNEYSQAVFNLPWLVAQEESLFAAEDIEVEFLQARQWALSRRGRPTNALSTIGWVSNAVDNDVHDTDRRVCGVLFPANLASGRGEAKAIRLWLERMRGAHGACGDGAPSTPAPLRYAEEEDGTL